MRKAKLITAVVVTWLLLTVLLLSQYDFGFADTGKPFDKKVTDKLVTGGTVTSQVLAIWELEKYKETQLPKKYPFIYAPWESYVAIDRYVTIEARPKTNAFIIDPNLYETVEPIAKQTRAEAKAVLKRIGVKGKTKADYMKIRKYVRGGSDIKGVKTALGFFENYGGDCCGHSSAVYVLCKCQGIPVRFVIGSYLGNLHAWNKVKLNGVWYWVDETYEFPLERKLEQGYYGVMVMW